jgi:hypothetical protein
LPVDLGADLEQIKRRMAQLPPNLLPAIPDRPADRPETWSEYLSRRAIVAMHRQFADELASWLPTFDPFRYFIDMAGNRVPFTKPGKPLPLTYGAKRVPMNMPINTVLIDVTKLDIDLAPELKELTGPRKRRAGSKTS